MREPALEVVEGEVGEHPMPAPPPGSSASYGDGSPSARDRRRTRDSRRPVAPFSSAPTVTPIAGSSPSGRSASNESTLATAVTLRDLLQGVAAHVDAGDADLEPVHRGPEVIRVGERPPPCACLEPSMIAWSSAKTAQPSTSSVTSGSSLLATSSANFCAVARLRQPDEGGLLGAGRRARRRRLRARAPA